LRKISMTNYVGSALGKHNGMQYVLAAEGGYPLKLGGLMAGSTLTPLAGMTYSYLTQNGYSESGSSAALAVSGVNTSSVRSDIGAKLSHPFSSPYGDLLPSAQLTWRHEYQNQRSSNSAYYTADSTGASNFTSTGTRPLADTGVLTLGMSLLRSKHLTLSGQYQLEKGSGYTGQSANLNLRYQF